MEANPDRSVPSSSLRSPTMIVWPCCFWCSFKRELKSAMHCLLGSGEVMPDSLNKCHCWANAVAGPALPMVFLHTL